MFFITENKEQRYEQEHKKMLLESAPECTLFLERNGDFPLKNPCKIALYGNGARHTVIGGTGSGGVNVRKVVSIEEQLMNSGFQVTTEAWLNAYEHEKEEGKKRFIRDIKEQAQKMGVPPLMVGMGKSIPEIEYELPLDGEGDTAIYVLSRNSGEGADRRVEAGDILLTETEKRDILLLNEKYQRFMLVLNTGGLVDLSQVQQVKNILLLGQLGSVTAEVFVNILLGKSVPSGKLAMTWADIENYPSTDGFGNMNDTLYTEGIYVGYRYFDTKKVDTIYPFGYGLGYTDFAFTETAVDNEIRQIATIKVRVKNTGNYRGREVVQVYVSAPGSELDKPKKELKAFAKTRELNVGESEELILKISTNDLASYDEKKEAFVLEKGTYTFFAGNSSENIMECGKLVVAEEKVTEEKRKEPVVYQEYKKTPYITWTEVQNGAKTVEEFVGSLSKDELMYLCIGDYTDDGGTINVIGSSSGSVAGAAGETSQRLSDRGVPSVVMADGPAGLRISPVYKVVNGNEKSLSNSLGEEMLMFIEPEDLQKMEDSMQKETEEEKSAPILYQYCTAIPIGTAIAQSWNPDVAKECGDIVGQEMTQFGVQLWLAPALNIQRSPLCGRNFEYYSEDPLLSGKIAAAITDGVQSHKGCGVCLKHFACNNQETNRSVSNSVVSERALREIYLKGFEICVKEASPYAMMSAYVLVNGRHINNRRDILTDILRGEWEYDGIVMTDWYATQPIMATPGSRYTCASAAGCVKAGNDLVMPGVPEDKKDMEHAFNNMEHEYPLSLTDLQNCARRILSLILKLKCSE